MNKMNLAAATIALAAILPFASAPAFAETAKSQATLCTEAPAKAAKAGIDCTATSAIDRDENKAAKQYPSGPVNFGNGIVF
ncbi:MAG: hypothetical protein ABJN75_01110 [Hoeflea sp.]|uniref:hypothetical protein n=1 Tax=Hoeflea sp. TaxID=1940281 RepID=UPI003299652C|tara:strand:- start:1192 stop:1434 length:243 start_codon:yes stop_codon:yes gene_type:complete